MTSFYDPIKRAPHNWVIASAILVPIILLIIILITGSNAVKNKPITTKVQESDIFAKDQ